MDPGATSKGRALQRHPICRGVAGLLEIRQENT